MTRPTLRHPNIHGFAGQDIPWLLEQQARRRGDHPFLIWEPFNAPTRVWTYASFLREVNALAAGLYRRGVRSGEKVLVHLDNCPESVLTWYACARLGAVAVTTNARSSPAELDYFAEHCEAVAAVTQPKFAEAVANACRAARFIAVTETDGGEDPENGKAPPPDQAFSGLFGDPDTVPERARDPWAEVGIQYTSGTTSRPKGVVWTHANALWGAQACAFHEDLRADDVHLVYLPLFHTNAQSYSVLACLWAGATAVIQPKFSASRFWDVSLKHKCTWTSTIPFCFKALAKNEIPKEHHYRLWGTGINFTPEMNAFFGVKCIGWWGMTETITQGIVGSPYFENTGMAMGRPSALYDIVVLDHNERPVEAGATGDLRIRGVPSLSLFKEYLKNPQATEDCFDDQGFFKTGDLVTLLEDGSLKFADRDKDMLKIGAENVAASEIETVIAAVPGVAEVAVVAKPDEMLDEVAAAFVIVDPDIADPDTIRNNIEKACTDQLANFKCPREIRFVEELPRSTLEKIAKAQLRAQLKAETGQT